MREINIRLENKKNKSMIAKFTFLFVFKDGRVSISNSLLWIDSNILRCWPFKNIIPIDMIIQKI